MEAEMDRGVIQVYYGEGHGKSTAAIGNAIRIASEGKSAVSYTHLTLPTNSWV